MMPDAENPPAHRAVTRLGAEDPRGHDESASLRVDPIARLIQVLRGLPGIGEKSAMRIAFHVLREGPELAAALSSAILDATERVHLCPQCMDLTDRAVCRICEDPRRDRRSLCVVETVQDLRAIERSHEYQGLYHVLHGVLAPLDGVGPEALRIKELLGRLESASAEVSEIIVATNPSVEGEATALYLLRLLRPMGYRVTRIASGMPIGGDFEYADPATISQAFSHRREMS